MNLSGNSNNTSIQSAPSVTETPREVISTITSLKEIVTIVTGLTITRSVIQLITVDGGLTLKDCLEGCSHSIGILPLLLFIVLMMNVIRFYHGNMRHLDTTYILAQGVGDVRRNSGKSTATDFFVVFFQSLLFSVLSFLIQKTIIFFVFFTGLLAFDMIWVFSLMQTASEAQLLKKWALNNTIATFLLLVSLAFVVNISESLELYDYLVLEIWIVIALNTIIDFLISWKFYFPKVP